MPTTDTHTHTHAWAQQYIADITQCVQCSRASTLLDLCEGNIISHTHNLCTALLRTKKTTHNVFSAAEHRHCWTLVKVAYSCIRKIYAQHCSAQKNNPQRVQCSRASRLQSSMKVIQSSTHITCARHPQCPRHQRTALTAPT